MEQGVRIGRKRILLSVCTMKRLGIIRNGKLLSKRLLCAELSLNNRYHENRVSGKRRRTRNNAYFPATLGGIDPYEYVCCFGAWATPATAAIGVRLFFSG